MQQQHLKLIYKKIKDKKKKRKIIMDIYKEALGHEREYPDLVEEIKTLNAKKKLIEKKVQDSMEIDLNKADDIKQEIQKAQAELATTVIGVLVEGESANFIDSKKDEFEPIIKVTYKRV